MLPIIANIYATKQEHEPFVLSAGHSALALYCVLESQYGVDAQSYIERYGTHPDRNIEDLLYASTGSLGHGIGIALGMALADPSRNVFVALSDGECAEGSVWEALRIKDDLNVTNLRIYVNINGYGAIGEIDKKKLTDRLCSFTHGLNIYHTDVLHVPFLNEIEAHYYKMNKRDWDWVRRNS